MKGDCNPMQPTVTLLGHSLGGATAWRVARRLAELGIHVNFLFTLDAVGGVDGLLSLEELKVWPETRSSLDDPDTYWSNNFSYGVADAATDLPIPILSNIIGGALGYLFSGIGTDTLGDGTAAFGDRWGDESGASVNNWDNSVHHENATGYLDSALSNDKSVAGSPLNTGLVKTGIIVRRP